MYSCQSSKQSLFITRSLVGVPIMGPTYLFGDNLSTVINSTKSDGQKALEYPEFQHQVCEAVTHVIVYLFHIDSKNNTANVLSRHTSSNVWYELMIPLIFLRAVDQSKSMTCRREGTIHE